MGCFKLCFPLAFSSGNVLFAGTLTSLCWGFEVWPSVLLVFLVVLSGVSGGFWYSLWLDRCMIFEGF